MKKFAPLLLLGFAATGCFAQDGLVEIWKSAKEQSPRIKAMKFSVLSMERQFEASGKLPDPEFELGFSLNGFDRNGMGGQANITAALSQMIPSAGKLSLEKKLAETRLETARASLFLEEIDLGSELSTVYFQIGLAARKIGIARQKTRSLAAVRDAMKTMYEASGIPLSDLMRMEQELTVMEAEVIGMETELAALGSELDTLTGSRGGNLSRPTVKFDTDLSLRSAAELTSLLDGAPTLKVLALEVKAAEVMEEMARKARNPDFSIRGEYMPKDPSMGDSDRVSLMAGITLPFLRKKSKYDPLAAAAAYERMMRSELLAQERTRLLNELGSLSARLSGSAEEVRLYSALEAQAAAAFETTEADYASGRTDLSSLLAALNGRFDAEEKKAEAEARFSDLKVQLDCCLGFFGAVTAPKEFK